MQRIEQLKLELSKAIKESPEYIEYKRLEAIIDKDPNLKRSIDEFRRQNFDIQNSGKVDDIFAAQEDLNNRYADMKDRIWSTDICCLRSVCAVWFRIYAEL